MNTNFWYVRKQIIDVLVAAGATDLKSIKIVANSLDTYNWPPQVQGENSLTHGEGGSLTFSASSKKITWSGWSSVNNWSNFWLPGMGINVSGSESNDGYYTVVSINGAELTVAESLADETTTTPGDVTFYGHNTNGSQIAYGTSSVAELLFIEDAQIDIVDGCLKMASGVSVFGLLDATGGTDPFFKVVSDATDSTRIVLNAFDTSSVTIDLDALSGKFTYAMNAEMPAAFVEPTNIVLVGTKVVGEVEVDPTANDVKYNDAALPVGSILRNTVSGFKYLKSDTGVRDFVEIPAVVDPAWGLAAGADDAWAILQAK